MHASWPVVCRSGLLALGLILWPRLGVSQVVDADLILEASSEVTKTQPDGVVRIAWARKDVPVEVDGLVLPPAAGLTSWAAFAPAADKAMLMGDTVVFEDEVDAAMDAAFGSGLEVTGLHNHFFYDRPKVYFMHIGGHGDQMHLAGAVKSVWDAIKAVRKAKPRPANSFGGRSPASGKIDGKALSNAIGHTAELNGGVAKVTVGREGRMHGHRVAASMGLTTWAAFTGSDQLAAVDGDVIMTAEEVQPVLRALRAARFHVVALHNHMIGEQPVFYFVHFWSKGPALDLARGFRSVLDAQAAGSASAQKR